MAITTNARALITGVFRLLGITAQGETPTSAEVIEALARLNEMLDGWALQPQTMRTVGRHVFDLVASQSAYTIGVTADTPDWELAARPTTIQNVTLLLTNATPDTEIPLSELTEAAYQAIQQKDLENSLPTAWYYEATMPTATLQLWPVPTDASNQIVLYVPEAAAQFANLVTEYTFAPGYVDALRYNLARRLAPEYGVTFRPDLAILADETLGHVKRQNVPLVDLALDPGLLPMCGRYGYNIYTDN